MTFLTLRDLRLLCLTLLTAATCAAIVGCASVPTEQAGSQADKQSEADDPLFQTMAAELALQQGDMGTAYARFMQVARQTRDPSVAKRAMEIALAGRGLPQALDAALLWRNLEPASTEAVEYAGLLYVASDRSEEAKPLFVEQLQRSNDRVTTLGRIQSMLARAPDRKVSLNLLDELAVPYRDDAAIGADVRLVLARASQAAGLSDRAQQEVQEALRLRPDFERAAIANVQLMLRPADTKTDKEATDKEASKEAVVAQQKAAEKNARDFLRGFVERNPKAQEARITYARLLVSTEDLPAARAQFEQVIAQDERNLDALYALGVLALDTPPPRKQAQQYLERYLSVLESAPDAARDPDPAYMNLARIAEDEKRYDEALKWLARVDDGEQAFNARLREALVLGKAKRLDEGRLALAALEPRNDAARIQVTLTDAQLLREARRYKESFDVLQSALAQTPDDPGLLYDAAMAAEKLNRFDVMERHLRRVMEVKPDDAHAPNALGYTFADRNMRLQEAYELIDKALKLAPQDAYILDSMGWIYFRLGKLDKARDYLERAFKSRPDVEVGVHLGEVLWVQGERTRARQIWREMRSKEPDNAVLRGTLRRLNVRL